MLLKEVAFILVVRKELRMESYCVEPESMMVPHEILMTALNPKMEFSGLGCSWTRDF